MACSLEAWLLVPDLPGTPYALGRVISHVYNVELGMELAVPMMFKVPPSLATSWVYEGRGEVARGAEISRCDTLAEHSAARYQLWAL